MTPDSPWPLRIAFVAAAGFAALLAPFVVNGILDALVPSELHSYLGAPMRYLVGIYIVVCLRRLWPPSHWCYRVDEDDEESVLVYDLHHPGIVGRGRTVGAAAADARHRYYRRRLR